MQGNPGPVPMLHQLNDQSGLPQASGWRMLDDVLGRHMTISQAHDYERVRPLQQAYAMRQMQTQAALQQQIASGLMGGDQGQASDASATVPSGPQGVPSSAPKPGVPARAMPPGGGLQRALAAQAFLDGKPAEAWGTLKKDVFQAADGSFVDKNTGQVVGKGDLAPDMAFENGVGYNKHDSSLSGAYVPKTPDGFEPVFDAGGIHGKLLGFHQPGDASNRIYTPTDIAAMQSGKVAGAQEEAKAPYGKPELFNLPGGPRYVSPAQYPTAFAGDGQPAQGSQPGSMRDMVIAEAKRQGVDPDLALSVMSKESGGQHYGPNGQILTSPKGALGVMQLMPGTAKEMGVDPTDPAQNVRGGVAYLKRQLDTFHDPRLAMAAYNAGPGAVQRHGGVPPYAETQAYVGQQPDVSSGPGIQAATARQFTADKRPDLKLPMGVYEQAPDGTVKPVQLPNADEQKRLEGLQSAATQAAEFAQMEKQFLNRNANEPTGVGYVGGDHNPIRQWNVHNNTNVGAMESLENQLLFKAKPDNVGQRILQSELPIWRGSTVALDNTYDVNAGIHGDHVKQAQIVNQKAQFYNQWWAQNHSLQGADQAWDRVMQQQGMGPHETRGQQRQAPQGQAPQRQAPPRRPTGPPAGATRTATGPNGQKAYLVNGKWVTQ